MCKCRPNVRTPFCGRLGCQWPHEEPTRLKNGHSANVPTSPDEVAELAKEVTPIVESNMSIEEKNVLIGIAERKWAEIQKNNLKNKERIEAERKKDNKATMIRYGVKK